MARFYENLGIGFLTESDEAFNGFLADAAQNGKIIKSYNGSYIGNVYGDVEIVLSLEKNGDNHKVVLADTHVPGNCVWDVTLTSANINKKNANALEKRCLVQKNNGEGLAVVNIINSDVLPSYREGDIVKMQMVAFPIKISYYKNEDEYEDSQDSYFNGKKLLLAEGAVLPVGMLNNRNPQSKEFDQNEDLDDIVNVRGTVKSLFWGRFYIGDVKDENSFISCTIDTEFGELEIVHTFEQVDENLRKNIRVGSVVDCHCVLSGDVAIFEYENGIVLDEEHNLRALGYMISGGDPERIRSILTENSEYFSEYNNTTYFGIENIIDRFKYTAKHSKKKCTAYMATIISSSNGKNCNYTNKRCLVLSYGDTENYESIVLIETDNDGYITNINIIDESKYRYKLDNVAE